MYLITLLIGAASGVQNQQLRVASLDIAAITTTTTPSTATTTTAASTTASTTQSVSSTSVKVSTSTAAPTTASPTQPVPTTTTTGSTTTVASTITSTILPGSTTKEAPTTTRNPSAVTTAPTTAPTTTTTTPILTTTIKIVYAAGDLQSINLLRDGLPSLFTRQAVQNVTTLQLIPYGNATEIKVNTLSEGFLYWHPELEKGNITNVYRCPNGEGECEASLIHACAIKVSNNDPSVYVPFIGCMSGSNGGIAPEDSSFACSNSTIFMESLRTCALGIDGIVLQHQLAEKAKGVTTIPSVFINGEPHPFNVSTATVTNDFTKLICDALFAQGRLDRDQCEGSAQKGKSIVLPFQSLLTPSSDGSSNIGKSY